LIASVAKINGILREILHELVTLPLRGETAKKKFGESKNTRDTTCLLTRDASHEGTEITDISSFLLLLIVIEVSVLIL